MRRYVGVDYHRAFSYVTVIDARGKTIREGVVGNSREAVGAFLRGSGCDGSAVGVLEATRNWTVMHDWLEEFLGEVHLAHPVKVKAIAEAKIKTDKIDARVLADLLRADLVPEAYVASREAREVRLVLRRRMFLVRVRTMVKNRIVGVLDRYPEQMAHRPTKEVFSKQGIAWLRCVELKEVDRKLVDDDLALLEELSRHIGRTEGLVSSLSEGDERVKLLRTIPGLGDFFSLLIAYEVDDIRRFASEKKFFSYIGIIPSTRCSGGKTFHGCLTKQGNKYLRWAFIEAVYPAIRKDRWLRAYYERLKVKKGPNLAKVATARKLAGIAYRVLSEGRAYQFLGLGLSS